MKEHDLKVIPPYFDDIWSLRKTWEVRKNDRDYQVGDTLILNEFDPETNDYTSKFVKAKVKYILHGGQFGIEEGYCVMTIDLFGK